MVSPEQGAGEGGPAPAPTKLGEALRDVADTAREIEARLAAMQREMEAKKKAKLAELMGKTHAGVPLDPELLEMLAVDGALSIARVGLKFTAWSADFLSTIPDAAQEKIRPHLRAIFSAANRLLSKPENKPLLDQLYAKEGAAPEEAAPEAAKAEEATEPEEQAAAPATEERETDTYAPRKVPAWVPPGAPHNVQLVESISMEATPSPEPAYELAFVGSKDPKHAEMLQKGVLSRDQVEVAMLAGAQHEQLSDDGTERRGFFVGDGTGVGKTREALAIIADNALKGRRRAVVVSVNERVLKDWEKEHAKLSKYLDLPPIIWLGKIDNQDEIPDQDGIILTTYAGFNSGYIEAARRRLGAFAARIGRGRPSTSARPRTARRFVQITNWAAKGKQGLTESDEGFAERLKKFEGVLVFDEAHLMGNAEDTGTGLDAKSASQRAKAGVEIQSQVPFARVVYASATGATEVENFRYATRLHLWGEGTPFKDGHDFVAQIAAGGLGAMELLAFNLKAMGKYVARNISFAGVEQVRHDIALTAEEEKTYEDFARMWQKIRRWTEDSLRKTNGHHNANLRRRIRGRLTTDSQRFFNVLLTAMQTPYAIEKAEEDLKEGRSPVFMFALTGGAPQERGLAAMGDEDDLDMLDRTPKEIVRTWVENVFPTQKYEEIRDPNTGRSTWVEVVDSTGKPVEDPDAVRKKNELLEEIAALTGITNPLDQIIDHFGPEAVAEYTGRKVRIVKDADGKSVKQKYTDAEKAAQLQEYKDAKRKVLAFSLGYGGTGASYHADKGIKNQDRRSLHVIQTGWTAAETVQGFGRVHRTNQSSAPLIQLYATTIPGHKRFVATIARRLDQLGALTKGQRQAAAGSLFTAHDNLESQLAGIVFARVWHKLLAGQLVIGSGAEDNLAQADVLTPSDFAEATGLRTTNADGTPADTPSVKQMMNGVLVLTPGQQRAFFNAFNQTLNETIEQLKIAGDFDTGVAKLESKTPLKIEEDISVTHGPSGTQQRYLRVSGEVEARFTSFADAFARADYLVEDSKGRIRAVYAVSDAIVKGKATKRFRILTPHATNYVVMTADEIAERMGPGAKDDTKVRFLRTFKKTAKGLEETTEALNKPAKRDDLAQKWDKEIEAAPKMRPVEYNLLTGILLPVWDSFARTGATARHELVRAELANGERVIAEVLSPNRTDDVLSEIGIRRAGVAAKNDPETIAKKLATGGSQALYKRGVRIVPAVIDGKRVLEIRNWDVIPQFFAAVGIWQLPDNEVGRFGFQRQGKGQKWGGSGYRIFVPLGEKGAATPDVLKALGRLNEVVPFVEVKALESAPADWETGVEEEGGEATQGMPGPRRPTGRPLTPEEIGPPPGPPPRETVMSATDTAPEEEPVRREDLREVLQRVLRIPIRKGHYPFGENVRGVYFPHSNKLRRHVIRTKEYIEMAAVSHEAGHGVADTALRGELEDDVLPEEVQRELRGAGVALYGPGLGKKKAAGTKIDFYTNEGFAEYIRHYVLGDSVEELFPETTEWFLGTVSPDGTTRTGGVVENSPSLRDGLAEARRIAIRYQGQGAVNRWLAAFEWLTDKTGWEGRWNQIRQRVSVARFRTAWITRTYWLHEFVKAAAEIRGVKPEEIMIDVNAGKIADALAGTAPGKVLHMIYGMMVDQKGRRVGQSLSDVFDAIVQRALREGGQEEVDRSLRRAAAWVAAARIMERERLNEEARAADPDAKTVPLGVSPEQVEDARRFYHALDCPEYRQVAEGIRAWADGLLHYMIQAGGLTESAAEKMRAWNPVYVPFLRHFGEEADRAFEGLGVGGSRIANLPPAFHRLGVSDRPIVNPIDALILEATRIVTMADKIRTARAIADLVQHTQSETGDPGIAFWAEKVSPKQQRTKLPEVKIEEIRRLIEDSGGDPSDLTDDMVTFYSTLYSADTKEPIVWFWRNGKREMWQLHPELYRAVMALDLGMASAALQVWSKFTRAVKLGATGLSLGFNLRNIQADFATRMITKHEKGIHPLWYVGTVLSAARSDKDWQNYLASGGQLTGFSGMDVAARQRAFSEALREKHGPKTLEFWKSKGEHPVDSLREMISFFENVPRAREFKEVFDAAIRRYATDPDHPSDQAQERAFLEALLASKEVTVNFTRGGTIAMAWSRVIPFFNAGIQGANRTVRLLTSKEAVRSGEALRALMRGLITITAPTVLLWLWNKDRDWYKQLSPQDKDRFWHFGDEKKEWFRVRKPHTLAIIFGSLPESLFNVLHGAHPTEATEAALRLVSDLFPTFMPAGSALAEVLPERGWDFFRGRDIVPYYLALNRLPHDRYLASTTAFSKSVAGALSPAYDFSPAKLDHVMGGLTGGLALTVIRSVEGLFGLTKKGPEGKGWQNVVRSIPGLETAMPPLKEGYLVRRVYDVRDWLQQAHGSKDPRYNASVYEALNDATEQMQEVRRRWQGGKLTREEYLAQVNGIAQRVWERRVAGKTGHGGVRYETLGRR